MEAKNYFLDRKMNLRKPTTSMKYGRLVVFIRHDSAEIQGFKYVLTLGIGTLKAMASTGVFVRVVRALKRSISCDSPTPRTVLTFQNIGKTTVTKRWAQREILMRGGATHRRNRTTEKSGRFDEIEYQDD